VSISSTLWAVPWTLILLILVLIAVAVAWRRRRSRRATGEDGRDVGEPADTPVKTEVPV